MILNTYFIWSNIDFPTQQITSAKSKINYNINKLKTNNI